MEGGDPGGECERRSSCEDPMKQIRRRLRPRRDNRIRSFSDRRLYSTTIIDVLPCPKLKEDFPGVPCPSRTLERRLRQPVLATKNKRKATASPVITAAAEVTHRELVPDAVKFERGFVSTVRTDQEEHNSSKNHGTPDQYMSSQGRTNGIRRCRQEYAACEGPVPVYRNTCSRKFTSWLPTGSRTKHPEENWPPLVREDTAGPVQSNSQRFHTKTGTSRDVLRQPCWPSIQESRELHNEQKVQAIKQQKSSRRQTITDSCIQVTTLQTKHTGSKHVSATDTNRHVTPVLLMLNKDFIVTSPLKENLLLTLALTEKKHLLEEDIHDNHKDSKRHVLVGQFTAFSSFLQFGLGHDARRVRTESNAGGTSTISESLSVEYFVRRFQAKDIVTEMEVEYCAMNWKKVDYICSLYGQRVGVSVTRAMSFPDPKDFSCLMAYRLLYKKLFGLVVARHGVSKRHNFSQCILHVWCETRETARILQQEYESGVSKELDIADDVILVLTVAEGWHARPIFYESMLRKTVSGNDVTVPIAQCK